MLALACVLAFAATYGVALHTARGLAWDRSAFEHVSGEAPLPFRMAGHRTLRTIDFASVAVALVVLALARGRVRRAVVAALVVVVSVGCTELLKPTLPVAAGRPSTFPSGHTAVAVSLGLALVLAVPPVLRPAAALAGAAYAAAIAFAVVELGWHYPSDAIGSFFVCGFWTALAALLLRGVPRRPVLSPRGVLVAVLVVAASLFIVAVVASQHPAAVDAVRSRPSLVVAAACYGMLSLALFAAVTPLVDERAA